MLTGGGSTKSVDMGNGRPIAWPIEVRSFFVGDPEVLGFAPLGGGPLRDDGFMTVAGGRGVSLPFPRVRETAWASR